MTRGEIIAERFREWQEQLTGVEICAVSKTMPPEDVNAVIAAGARHIGENRVQELLEKLPHLQTGPQIHLIGRLQVNKVKYLPGKVDLIQSVDRAELVREIEKRFGGANLTARVLLQVSPAGEPQKGGAAPEELFALAQECAECPHVRVEGLMAVMPAAEDAQSLRPYFKRMRNLYEELGRANLPGVKMEILSMGMSGDCRIAAEEGANMVRIGRGIFGARQ